MIAARPALLLIGGVPALGALLAQDASPKPLPSGVQVEFVSAAGPCGGMLAARWIITARHCVDGIADVTAAGGRVAIRLGGVDYEYRADDLTQLRRATPPNVVGEALSLDFALLPAPTGLVNRAPPPDPTAAQQLRGVSVRFTGFEGRTKTCTVEAVCGAQLQIGCHGPNKAVRGDSGHVLYAAQNERPVGILTANSSSDAAVATAYGTILGRSSALAAAWNEMRQPPRYECDLSRPDGRYCALSREFARSATYRYPLEKGSMCRAAAMPGRELDYHRLQSAGFFTAVVKVGDGEALLADASTGSLCSVSRGAAELGRCTPLPASFGRSVQALVPLSGGDFLVSQATTRRSADGLTVWSRLLVARWNPLTGVVTFRRQVEAPLRQVTSALQRSDGAIVIGGTGGLCILGPTTCDRLIWHPAAPLESDWVARGLLTMSDGTVLAVGRDYRDDGVSSGPGRRRVPIARCWVLGPVSGGFNYQRPCGYPTNAFVERLSQLGSPMLIGGEPIAFSSSGEAVSLAGGKIGRSIPFGGLMESSRPSAALDDVVRAASDNGDDTLTLAASDGTVRVVSVVRDSTGGLERLLADDTRTAFDLAIWIVGATPGKGWSVAIAQSGEAYMLSWPARQ